MDGREELNGRIVETHREYDEVTIVIRDMIHKRQEFGPEWEELVTRQIAALEKWLRLSRELQLSNAENAGLT